MLEQIDINEPMNVRLQPLKKARSSNEMLIHEIYASVQGESSYMGQPCVFVRTTGCHLRCTFCDTKHAFFAGSLKTLEQILFQVQSFGIKLVELTGGEPLLQKASFLLLDKLIGQGYTVLLETSGGVTIRNVNQSVKVILDVKCPDSGERDKNVWSNLDIIWPGCEVKFVISSHKDYLFAKEICEQYNLYQRTHVLFSPVTASLPPTILVDWIVSDGLPVRFQLQLHRVLYGETPGK